MPELVILLLSFSIYKFNLLNFNFHLLCLVLFFYILFSKHRKCIQYLTYYFLFFKYFFVNYYRSSLLKKNTSSMRYVNIIFDNKQLYYITHYTFTSRIFC